MSQITVYTKPRCVQCTATYRALDSKGIAYEVVDVSTNEDALELVKALGYLTAPRRHHAHRTLGRIPPRQDQHSLKGILAG